MINVTKTFFPPLEEYQFQLQRIWETQLLTNRGALVLELEKRIKQYLCLNPSNILITNNGTIPLQIALKLLGSRGEIITTPFSYVATTASIVWENCTPIFVDIHPEYLTIDETKIEEAITPRTTCILATHVFGNPCNVEEIERIAKKHNLKVIYDAAHCFGVKYKGESIFDYGDVSTCSFHATKIFHTGEGGALFSKDLELFDKLYYSHNFGHNGPHAFYGLGINAKISELQAAMGLAVLPFMSNILSGRKEVVDGYDYFLNFEKIKRQNIRLNTEWNFSYYPVLFSDENQLLITQKYLNDDKIFPRRYFYPSLDTLPYVTGFNLEISRSIASRILCLPLYHDLEKNEIIRISNIVNKSLMK